MRGSGLRLYVFADAQYAVTSNDRRSVSDVAVMLRDAAIGLKSSTQKSVLPLYSELSAVVNSCLMFLSFHSLPFFPSLKLASVI